MAPSASLGETALLPSYDASGESTRADLTSTMLNSLSVASVFRNHSRPVTSLDFHRSGEVLVSSGADDTLVFSSPLSGTVRKVLPVRKYGAGVVRFAHASAPPTLLTSSKAGAGDAVRALDVATCTYTRFYHGHAARVTSIAPSPLEPSVFLSASTGSVRLWDARRRDAVGEIAVGTAAAVAYDPKGLVFGVAHTDGADGAVGTHVRLYDARAAAEGPFMSFCCPAGGAEPTCFEFSADGDMFLLASVEVGNPVRVFDAFDGGLRREFVVEGETKTATHCARFSPDARFVLTGSENHGVGIWEVASARLVMEEKEVHPMAVDACAWNPKYGMVATACQNVALWLPSNL